MQPKQIISSLFFLILLCPVLPAFAQFPYREYRSLQLSHDLVQSQRIRSVMAMFQLNIAGLEEGEDYLPHRESADAYDRYRNEDFRKFLFYTSLGAFITYDTAGNITSEVKMGEKSYSTYTYNKQNNLVEQRETDLNYPTSSDTEMEIRYKYDDKGRALGYESGPLSVTLVRNKKGEVASWKVLLSEYRDPEEKAASATKPKVTDISGQYKFDKQGRILKQQDSPDYYDLTEYSENPATTTSLSYVHGQLREKIIRIPTLREG